MSDMFHWATSYAEILREVQRYIDKGNYRSGVMLKTLLNELENGTT